MKLVNIWIEHPVLKLDQTFSYYYDGFICRGLRVVVNFRKQKLVGFVDNFQEFDTLAEINQFVNYSCKPILEVLDDEPLLNQELFDLGKKMAYLYAAPTISCFNAMLPSFKKAKLTAKKQQLIRYVKISQQKNPLTKLQQIAYNDLKSDNHQTYQQFLNKYPNITRTLIKKGVIEDYYCEKKAICQKTSQVVKKKLTPLQEEAIAKISQTTCITSLLHGVTGSGKTEIYLHLADYYLKQEKQVLLLVPEISLTPQMEQRVKERFQDEVAIYHSSLSAQSKYEQYQLVKQNKVKIVVGTRSSIFMPFNNIGIIIIDEEHDNSYKQEVTPCYHVHEIAQERAKYHHCKIVIGSATPSLESYSRAYKGIYELIELKQRINDKFPEIEIINLKNTIKNKESYILSNQLIKEIEQCLNNHQQIILLLNRRGYHTSLSCKKCGAVVKCKHCDLPLVYHHNTKNLVCHTCGYVSDPNQACVQCGTRSGFVTYGYGTEKVQDMLYKIFPKARIARMDKDTTTKKGSHKIILEAFGKYKYDILLGTQMIAKGLDYPKVTLVGILNADAGLNYQSYRSVENCFALLMQASGRAGRADFAGKVVLQVFNPQHYAIKAVIKQSYHDFFYQEMKFRHLAQYPPYNFLAAIYIDHHNEDSGLKQAQNVSKYFKQFFKVLGPVCLLKKRDIYTHQIIIKSKDLALIRKVINQFIKDKNKDKKINLRININPLNLE